MCLVSVSEEGFSEEGKTLDNNLEWHRSKMLKVAILEKKGLKFQDFCMKNIILRADFEIKIQ